MGAWWNKDNRPPPEHLFYPYKRIPRECRRLLERCVWLTHFCIGCLVLSACCS